MRPRSRQSLLRLARTVAAAGLPLTQIAACNGEMAQVCPNQTPLVRQFASIENVRIQPLPECVDGRCSNGETCFKITHELAVCDRPELTLHGGDCTSQGSSATFECGCDGRTCPSGLLCIEYEFTCSCAPQRATMCAEPRCSTAADCPAGTVCVPTSLVEAERCVVPECESDSDCRSGENGRCALVFNPPTQEGELKLEAIRCVYPPCGAVG
jgi:hypothetical protein